MAVYHLRGGHIRRQIIDIEDAPHIIQTPHALQLFRHRQDIRRLALVRQIQDRLKYDRIRFAVEIRGRQLVLGRHDRVLVE